MKTPSPTTNTTNTTKPPRRIRVLASNGGRFAAALTVAGFEARFLGPGTAHTSLDGGCSDPNHCQQHESAASPHLWGSVETTASGNQAHAVWKKLPKWQLYYEMAEDYRHKSEVGPVPPAALDWLEDHWEFLPRNGEQVTGMVQEDPDGKVRVFETIEIIFVDDDGHRQTKRTLVFKPEEVDL